MDSTRPRGRPKTSTSASADGRPRRRSRTCPPTKRARPPRFPHGAGDVVEARIEVAEVRPGGEPAGFTSRTVSGVVERHGLAFPRARHREPPLRHRAACGAMIRCRARRSPGRYVPGSVYGRRSRRAQAGGPSTVERLANLPERSGPGSASLLRRDAAAARPDRFRPPRSGSGCRGTRPPRPVRPGRLR